MSPKVAIRTTAVCDGSPWVYTQAQIAHSVVVWVLHSHQENSLCSPAQTFFATHSSSC